MDASDEALQFMEKALAILDRGPPTAAVCHLQNAIDLLRATRTIRFPSPALHRPTVKH